MAGATVTSTDNARRTLNALSAYISMERQSTEAVVRAISPKGRRLVMIWAEIISAVCALVAAGFWFWSAAVPVPDLLQTPMSDGSITDIMRRQSRLSAIAAVFAGASAIAAAVAVCLKISS